MVAFAVTKTKGKKLGKILLYNGSVVGIMVLAAIIIIKYKKPFSPLRKNKDWLMICLYFYFIFIYYNKLNVKKLFEVPLLKNYVQEETFCLLAFLIQLLNTCFFCQLNNFYDFYHFPYELTVSNVYKKIDLTYLFGLYLTYFIFIDVANE